MDQLFRNEKDSPSQVETTPSRSDDNELNKIMKQVGQVDHGDGGNDFPMETTTMTLGSTTETGQFVQLPPELLTTILTNLDKTNDLIPFRQVNSTWRVLISPILRQRENFEIKISEIDNLDSLNGSLKNCKKLFLSLDSFPCVRFFLSNFKLEEENVQTFFDLYGSSIQSLELYAVQVSVEDGHLKSLSRLLTQQAPNIKHFEIEYLNIHPELVPTGLFSTKQTKLPHLQSLGQHSLETWLDQMIMKKIMKAADNLKVYSLTIGIENLNQLYVFASTGKVQTLKEIRMGISRHDMQFYEKFARLQPTLERFFLDCWTCGDSELFSRASAVINKILQSSKDTLTTFKVGEESIDIPGLQFPVLNKVKVLDINQEFAAIFPRGQRLSTIFPKVCEVTLHLYHPTGIFWNRLMENNFPSVHTLTISCLNNVEGLCRVFPNLKNLLVICPKLDVVGEIFEHMKGLETLEFHDVDDSLPENQFPAFDSILTGFSRATCLKLASSGATLEDGEATKLREKLSILELTGLKTLKIRQFMRLYSGILSRVSGIWAFQKMPQVKVTVTSIRHGSSAEILQAQEALDVIAPFVHSVGFEEW